MSIIFAGPADFVAFCAALFLSGGAAATIGQPRASVLALGSVLCGVGFYAMRWWL